MEKRLNYFVVFVRDTDDFEWRVFETTGKEYAVEIFKGLVIPPEYDRKELRATEESGDTHLSYEVLESVPMA